MNFVQMTRIKCTAFNCLYFNIEMVNFIVIAQTCQSLLVQYIVSISRNFYCAKFSIRECTILKHLRQDAVRLESDCALRIEIED